MICRVPGAPHLASEMWGTPIPAKRTRTESPSHAVPLPPFPIRETVPHPAGKYTSKAHNENSVRIAPNVLGARTEIQSFRQNGDPPTPPGGTLHHFFAFCPVLGNKWARPQCAATGDSVCIRITQFPPCFTYVSVMFITTGSTCPPHVTCCSCRVSRIATDGEISFTEDSAIL